MYVCMNICMYVRMCVPTMSLCTYVCMYVRTYVGMYVYVCLSVRCTYICMHVCMHKHAWYVCLYVSMHFSTYLDTECYEMYVRVNKCVRITYNVTRHSFNAGIHARFNRPPYLACVGKTWSSITMTIDNGKNTTRILTIVSCCDAFNSPWARGGGRYHSEVQNLTWIF